MGGEEEACFKGTYILDFLRINLRILRLFFDSEMSSQPLIGSLAPTPAATAQIFINS